MSWLTRLAGSGAPSWRRMTSQVSPLGACGFQLAFPQLARKLAWEREAAVAAPALWLVVVCLQCSAGLPCQAAHLPPAASSCTVYAEARCSAFAAPAACRRCSGRANRSGSQGCHAGGGGCNGTGQGRLCCAAVHVAALLDPPRLCCSSCRALPAPPLLLLAQGAL